MSKFYPAIKCSDLPEGKGRKVIIDGKDVALFHINGVFHAVSDTCPHRGGPISEGVLSNSVVACPWHGWGFDLRTGACRIKPDAKLMVYPIKIEDNKVLIKV